MKAAFPVPPVRARRRVETPPGTQPQAYWAHFPGVLVTSERKDLRAFSLQFSFRCCVVIVCSEGAAQLAWLSVRNEVFARFFGVRATVRVDDVKTAISRGACAGSVSNSIQHY